MPPIVEVKNLSKKYKIGERQGYVALRDVLMNIVKSPARWFGSKVKSSLGKESVDDFWALKNVNFNVEQGEILGIIGRNGAGKSTLLKILSQITPPTTGEIKLRGRVGSLLEVGTGFHPELTGRENIYLNGSILGMRKKEIEKKFDEIVEFSGIGKFLDTPVKRYSSGMYVRLAFSVAAHLEPDILIIDEVLAVGDTEFQKKCLGKMEDVTKKEGRTVLFVSHNMAAVQQLCSKTIFLENGQVKSIGDTSKIINEYINDATAIKNSQQVFHPDKTKAIAFTKIWTTDKNGNITNHINCDDEFRIWLEFNVNQPTDMVEISLSLKNSSRANILFTSLSDSCGKNFYNFNKPGTYVSSALIKGNFLMPDNYLVRISAHLRNTRDIDLYEDAFNLVIKETGNSVMAPYGSSGIYLSAVLSDTKWEVECKN